jgi:hypothetical protein
LFEGYIINNKNNTLYYLSAFSALAPRGSAERSGSQVSSANKSSQRSGSQVSSANKSHSEAAVKPRQQTHHHNKKTSHPLLDGL